MSEKARKPLEVSMVLENIAANTPLTSVTEPSSAAMTSKI